MIHAIKLSAGALVGLFFASLLNLNNPLTAGIIVFLSLGKTKRSSIDIARTRIKAVTLALILAGSVFFLAGFSVYAFGLFLLLYVPLIVAFRLDDGLVLGAVLATHFIAAEAVDPPIFINTILLFVIGVTVALIFNLYMPDRSEDMRRDRRQIEHEYRDLLLTTTTILRGDQNFKKERLHEVENLLNATLQRARLNDANHLRIDVTDHTRYMQMRNVQFRPLSRMFQLASRLNMNLDHAEVIAQLTETLAHTLSETNSGDDLLVAIEASAKKFGEAALPQSRAEFENRAVLFQYLSELRHFISVKRDFSHLMRKNH